MALINNNTGDKFANINKEGKIEIWNKGGENPVYDAIEGYITNIQFKQDSVAGEDYEALVIHISDGPEAYQLKMRFDSGYGRSLANKLPNCDLSKKVKLQPSRQTINDKTQTSFFVTQNGVQVKQKWTKDNPGNMPPLSVVRVKGKDVYDNTNQMAFLKNVLSTLGFSAPVSEPNNPEPITSENEDFEQLPF